MRPGTTRFHRQLRFERLESRELLSGVTATLDHGALTVTGASDSSSTIHVWRHAGRILVDGVAGSFAATQVRSISVACGQNGNQTVDLGIRGGHGQTPLARPVTVASGGGNETVRLGSTRVYFAGAGHQLTVSAKGTVRLDGAKPGWFDTHLEDAAIRSLAKASYGDHVLGRTDMLAIFDTVEQQGDVTAVELSDLQAIVRNSKLFSGVAYVQNLSAKVVLGNHANAQYQGQALGNLAANDPAGHLEDLVDKWFLGLDRPVSTFDHETFVYAEAAGSLFHDSPVYTDVDQGRADDCYLLAGLAEIAMHNPEAIESMFIVNGDGTYTVRFYHGHEADYVTVDSYLPADAEGRYVFANYGHLLTDTTIALWVPLAEKAYAQINEEGWLRSDGQNSYESIDYGSPSSAFAQVTGEPAKGQLKLDKPWSLGAFVGAYWAGSLLCLSSKGAPSDPLIVEDHCYAVVRYDAATRSLLVFNPWGINNGSEYPGLLWLSWDKVVDNFRSWSWGV